MSDIGNAGIIIVSAIILIVSVAIYLWNVFFKDIPANSNHHEYVSDDSIEEARRGRKK